MLDRPCVAAAQQRRELAFALPLRDADLLGHQLVVDRALDVVAPGSGLASEQTFCPDGAASSGLFDCKT